MKTICDHASPLCMVIDVPKQFFLCHLVSVRRYFSFDFSVFLFPLNVSLITTFITFCIFSSFIQEVLTILKIQSLHCFESSLSSSLFFFFFVSPILLSYNKLYHIYFLYLSTENQIIFCSLSSELKMSVVCSLS